MRYLLVLLLLLPFSVFGQTFIPTGSVTQGTYQRGGYGADSVLSIPVGDTIPRFTSYRNIGRVMVNKTDSGLYYHDGAAWVKVSLSADIDTGKYILNQMEYGQDGGFYTDSGRVKIFQARDRLLIGNLPPEQYSMATLAYSFVGDISGVTHSNGYTIWNLSDTTYTTIFNTGQNSALPLKRGGYLQHGSRNLANVKRFIGWDSLCHVYFLNPNRDATPAITVTGAVLSDTLKLLKGLTITNPLNNIRHIGIAGIGFAESDLLTDYSVYSVANGNNRWRMDGVVNNTVAPTFSLFKSRGAAGARTSVINADTLGKINFMSYDGASELTSSAIWSQVTGSPTTGSVPTSMYFKNDGYTAVLSNTGLLTTKNVTTDTIRGKNLKISAPTDNNGIIEWFMNTASPATRTGIMGYAGTTTFQVNVASPVTINTNSNLFTLQASDFRYNYPTNASTSTGLDSATIKPVFETQATTSSSVLNPWQFALWFDRYVRAQAYSTGGKGSRLFRNATTGYSEYLTDEVVTVSTATATLEYGLDYDCTVTSTLTLPAISATIKGRNNAIWVMNRSAGTVTVNANGGASVIFATSLVNSVVLNVGESYIFYPNGTYFKLM